MQQVGPRTQQDHIDSIQLSSKSTKTANIDPRYAKGMNRFSVYLDVGAES